MGDQTQVQIFFTPNQVDFSIHQAKSTYISRLAGTPSKPKSNSRRAKEYYEMSGKETRKGPVRSDMDLLKCLRL